MSASDGQRRLLGDFVRLHREASRPEPLPPRGGHAARRRTPGLRREELAELCGLSTTWYTWLEQGRDISLSPAALARLADALRLTAPERAYLFELARRRDPSPPPGAASESESATPTLVAALRVMTAPAYLLDRLWRARAWNEPAGRLLSPWLGSGEPCLLRFVFLDPEARRFVRDWEARAERLVAEFRADTARHPGDAGMRALVDELLAGSRDFARFWEAQGVLGRDGGRRIFHHPVDGRLSFEQITLAPAGHPDAKLVMLLPVADPEPSAPAG